MAAIFWKVDSSDRELEERPQYVKRLGNFFAANAIETDDKSALFSFRSVIGPTSYKLLWNLVAADMHVDKPFATLVTVLEKDYSPKPS